MKLRLLFVLFTILPHLLVAQETHSIFWEASHPDYEKPIYIFGTHHFYNYDFIQNNPNIDSLLQASDIMVGELVIGNNMMDIGLIFQLANSMMMTDNSLDRLLSEKDFKATDQFLRENMGMGIKPFFNNVKPIFIYQLVSLSKLMKEKPGVSPEQMPQNPGDGSMDEYFQTRARELGKEVRGLETAKDQLSALYGNYSIDEQVELLLKAVYAQEENQSEEYDINDLNKLYAQQDLEGLLKLMKLSSSERELENLLTKRNENWIIQIKEMSNENIGAFIAVGAGHLPGKSGVLELLRQAGYATRPISIQVQ